MSSIDEINRKIESGSVVVVTADELKRRVSEGEKILGEVDVVTCGTCGVMSGTYAVLSVPVAKPGTFLRAERITLNGVPALPGPCPNERLGLVDCIVYGTAHADSRYGGGDLFRDIIAGEEITAEVTAEGKTYSRTIPGGELPHARLFTTRSAFKNYTAILNRSTDPVHTIFSTLPLGGNCSQVTVSGCGQINPLENDPGMRFIRPGMQVLVNGGPGYLIGTGTRSSDIRPNISVHGEMAGMDPFFCGGFVTSAGPECLTSIGTAIPLIDEAAVATASVMDKDIRIPIMDISDRGEVGSGRYDQIWTGTSRSVRFHPERCTDCDEKERHRVRSSCPVDAIGSSGAIDHHRCFCCGTCSTLCPDAYEGHFGSLLFEESPVPIVLRQSDRRRAEILCRKLKLLIEEGKFRI